ncbi:MAG: hypothetical protein PVH19_08300 [Planctomycetia bacterium]
MTAPKPQSKSAVSQRSVQRMREAIDAALSRRIIPEAKEYPIPTEPGPDFPKVVPKIPGLRPIAPSSTLQTQKQPVQEKNESEWHVVTAEGAAAVGKHYELLERVAREKADMPEVILVRGNPGDHADDEAIRIRLCSQDGEPTSLEDLELEEVPDVVPFVDKQDESLSQLIEAWSELDQSTKDAILLLVKASAG